MHRLVVICLLPLATQALFWGNSCGCQQACPAPPVCAPVQVPVCPPAPVCGGGASVPIYQGAPQFVAQPQYVPVAQSQYASVPQPAVQYVPAQSAGYNVGVQEVVGEPQAATSQGEEFATSGQQATVEQQQEPQEIVETSSPDTQAENTVYDDIAATAAAATAGEEYHALSAATRRRRVTAIRRAPAASFDPKCNSDSLKTLIQENIGDSTSSSKRAIQKAAAEEIGGHVDVICSTGTFSYIVNTELYCETEKDGITCFAFRQSN